MPIRPVPSSVGVVVRWRSVLQERPHAYPACPVPCRTQARDIIRHAVVVCRLSPQPPLAPRSFSGGPRDEGRWPRGLRGAPRPCVPPPSLLRGTLPATLIHPFRKVTGPAVFFDVLTYRKQ